MSLVTDYELGAFVLGALFGAIIGILYGVNDVMNQREKERKQ